MSAIIKKRDIVLAAVLLVLGISGVIILKYGLHKGSYAEVYIDDKPVKTINMDVDDEYVFHTEQGENVVAVKDGKIEMKSADCPDKVCVRMGAKNRSGETITCLPHKLVVEVHGGEAQEVDIK